MAIAMNHREEKVAFVRKLETVSSTLAIWAQERFKDDWSIDDVKVALKVAMEVCGKE